MTCRRTNCKRDAETGRKACAYHLDYCRRYEATRYRNRKFGVDAPGFIPAAPLAEWIATHGLSDYQIARRLVGRFGGSELHHRRSLSRLRQQQKVTVALADRIATALGAHLSWFDPYYDQVSRDEAQPA